MSLRFNEYNKGSATIKFEVDDGNHYFPYFEKWRLGFNALYSPPYTISQEYPISQTYPYSITLSDLRKLDAAYIEAFLYKLKHVYLQTKNATEEEWQQFVTNVWQSANNAKPMSLLEGIMRFKKNIFSNAVSQIAIKGTNEFLDIQDLSRFEEALLVTAPKEGAKRNFSSVSNAFEYSWKSRCNKHYPVENVSENKFSDTPKLPGHSKLKYRTAYLDSANTPTARRLVNRIIAGNLAAVTKILAEDPQGISRIQVFRNQRSTSLMDIAYEYKHEDILKLFWDPVVSLYGVGTSQLNFTKKNASGLNLLMLALVHYKNDLASHLVTLNIDPNAKNNEGASVLTYAAMMGNVPIIKALLDKKADLHSSRTEYPGCTALTLASMYNHPDAVSFLLKRGAKINGFTCNKKGTSLYTPLMAASWKNNNECVRILLEAKADYTLKNADNITALHHAVGNGNIINVQALLKKQAEDKVKIGKNPLLSASALAGNMPVHIALTQKNEQLAGYLLEAAASDADPDVLKNLLKHLNKKKDSILSLAAALPNSRMLEKIRGYVGRYKITFPHIEVLSRSPRVQGQNNIKNENTLKLGKSPASMFSTTPTPESKLDHPADKKSTASQTNARQGASVNAT